MESCLAEQEREIFAIDAAGDGFADPGQPVTFPPSQSPGQSKLHGGVIGENADQLGAG